MTVVHDDLITNYDSYRSGYLYVVKMPLFKFTLSKCTSNLKMLSPYLLRLKMV